jgi:tetratricopeptide (TPR) repeat protein
MNNPEGIMPPQYLKRINAALALREVPDYHAALTQIEAALEQNPSYAPAHLLLGLTYQDIGNLELAEASLRQALNLDPGSTETRQALGLLLMRVEKYADAVEILSPLIKREAHNPTVLQAFASALAHTRQKKRAVEVLQLGYSHWPEDVSIASQLGRLLVETHQDDRAIPVLERVVQSSPNVDALCDLAMAHLRQDHDEQAIECLVHATRLRDDYDRPWQMLSNCYLKTSAYDKALEAANQAIQRNPDDPRNWQSKALALLPTKSNDQFQLLEETLEKGLQTARRAPDGSSVIPNLLLLRATLVMIRSGPQAALEEIDRNLDENPKSFRLLHLKAQLLIGLGEYQSAQAMLGEAIAQGIDPEEVFSDQLQIYYGLEQSDKALDLLNSQLAKAKEAWGVLTETELVGIQLYLKRNIPAARTVFEQVLTVNPKRARSLNNLGFVLIGEGDWQQAEEMLRLALQHGFETPAVSLENLGYIYLRQRKYNEALEVLHEAEQQTPEKLPAILRVAYWVNNDFVWTIENRYPLRFISVQLAALANQAMAYFLLGQIEKAFDVIRKAIQTNEEDSVGYRVLGCLHLASGETEAARSAWTQALQMHGTKEEIAQTKGWLTELLPAEQ